MKSNSGATNRVQLTPFIVTMMNISGRPLSQQQEFHFKNFICINLSFKTVQYLAISHIINYSDIYVDLQVLSACGFFLLM